MESLFPQWVKCPIQITWVNKLEIIHPFHKRLLRIFRRLMLNMDDFYIVSPWFYLWRCFSYLWLDDPRKACITGGWIFTVEDDYSEGCWNQVLRNQQNDVPRTFEMLAGEGIHSDAQQQMANPPKAYEQISALAQQEWHTLPESIRKTNFLRLDRGLKSYIKILFVFCRCRVSWLLMVSCALSGIWKYQCSVPECHPSLWKERRY